MTMKDNTTTQSLLLAAGALTQYPPSSSISSLSHCDYLSLLQYRFTVAVTYLPPYHRNLEVKLCQSHECLKEEKSPRETEAAEL
jgi:hypothetical protein